MSSTSVQKLGTDLQKTVDLRFGPGHRVECLAVMEDGHAGLTFGFDLASPDRPAARPLILKLSPPGVRRSGNTDVYRQAPLLEALRGAGAPVPAICFAAPDETELGVPFIVMERLPGRTFVVWDPHPSFARTPDSIGPLWEQAARALAAVHQVGWRQHLANWEKPRPLCDELAVWDKVLMHATEPRWLTAGRRLGEQLRGRIPGETAVGLVHGDFQPGNVLYSQGRVSGIVDWELAHIGSQALDVGWLMMMADRDWWHADWQPLAPLSPEELAAIYLAAGGPAASDLAWHRALAAYRLGSIACLNVKLHRSGKRADPLWDRFAPSISTLFDGALALLSQG